MASPRTLKRTIVRVLVYTFLVCFGGTMIIPFCWMLSTSFKRKHEVFQFPPKWIPTGYEATIDGKDVICTKIREEGDEILLEVVSEGDLKGQRITQKLSEANKVFAPEWRNYIRVWQAVPFGRFYLNSIFIALFITFGQVATSAMAAYAFARLSFPGRDYLFFGYLATLMIPRTVTMIPLFVILSHIPEWLNILFSSDTSWWSSDHYLFGIFVGRPVGMDSYFSMIVPGLFSAYGTFMMRQFLMSQPRDLEDAAKIDGCSLAGIFLRVTIPLAKPALATLTILTFMGSWRQFIWPLIVTNSKELEPIQVGLANFMGMYETEWTLLMAGSMMALIPVIIVFIIGQRFFVEGIRLGAVKG